MEDMIRDIRGFAECRKGCVYIVGGYIRDKLMHSRNNPEDLDIIYEGNINELIDYMKAMNYSVFALKEEMKIYRLVKEGKVIDVSILKGKNIEEDLGKRDFTINAIALDIMNNKIIDPFGGRRDLQNRIIKEVTENSIIDDRVRILRGIRLSIKYGMHFSSSTGVRIKEQSKYINGCTKERVFHELMKVISLDKDGIAFDVMDAYGFLEEFIPYIKENKTVGRCKYHIEDAFTHMNTVYKVYKELMTEKIDLNGFELDKIKRKIGEYEVKDYVAFASFNHDIGKYECYKNEEGRVSFINHDYVGSKIIKEFCRVWGFPKEAIAIITKVVEGHMYPLGLFKNNINNYKKSYYKFFRKYDRFVPYILSVSFSDVYATTMFLDFDDEKEDYKEFIEKLFEEYGIYNDIKRNRLLKGDEISELAGISGSKIAQVIDKIDEMRYKGIIENREEAVNFIRKSCIIKGDEV